MQFDIIVFHTQCPDGITSLWAANYHSRINEHIACRAGVEPVIENYSNKAICFVDICPSYEFICKLAQNAKQIVILDHHKTTIDMYNTLKKEVIPSNIEFILDFDRSGCQITWDYFFPKESERPWFVDYVGDRDLWTWKLENSKAVNTALSESEFFDPANLEKMTKLLDYKKEDVYNLINIGNIILKLHKKELDYSSYKAVEATFKVDNIIYNVWLGSCSSNLRSDLGNILAYKKNLEEDKFLDFAAIWNYEPKYNEWAISLRGHKNSPDLSVISGKFGGGGHAKASGFVIKNSHLLDVFKLKERK
jgi:oligoribonuclease NrnB/cAMP/cGMP phosphodiesterase (DHH superfamily)